MNYHEEIGRKNKKRSSPSMGTNFSSKRAEFAALNQSKRNKNPYPKHCTSNPLTIKKKLSEGTRIKLTYKGNEIFGSKGLK